MNAPFQDRQFSSGDVLKERVIESQLLVIEAIRRYPGCPILLQSLDETLNVHDCERESVLTAKVLFPRGIPSNVEDLTLAQKRALYEYGAADLMLLLGEIPTLHRAIHREVNSSLMQKALSGDYEATFTAIPKEAVMCAKEVFSSHLCANQNPPTALVIFGALHDFNSFCEAEGISHERIDAIPGAPTLANEAAPKVYKERFIHIRQLHANPHDRLFSSDDPLKECVVASQLKVAQAIKQYPDCPVLAESLEENINIKDCDRELVLRAKVLFPNGIPSNSEELSFAQKKMIYEFGAPDLLLLLGEIPTLHKTVQKEVAANLLKEALAGNSEIRFEAREQQAVVCAKEILSSQQCVNQDRPTVLVVFGGLHDFGPFCKAREVSYERVDAF